MELRCLGQTSGFRGCEPWVNSKPLPPSRRGWGGGEKTPVSLSAGDLLPEIRFLSLYEILALICETRG